nr:hypothetical protein [Deltaproteobacteria bacterium]
KLLANGYRIIENYESDYDPITQIKSNTVSYDIQPDKIIRSYEVIDKPLMEAKAAKKEHIRNLANSRKSRQYPDWVYNHDNIINALSTVVEVRKLTPTEPDYEAMAAKQEAARTEIIASDLSNKTYASVESYIDNNVTDLASAKKVMKKMGKLLLAILKRQDWST